MTWQYLQPWRFLLVLLMVLLLSGCTTAAPLKISPGFQAQAKETEHLDRQFWVTATPAHLDSRAAVPTETPLTDKQENTPTTTPPALIPTDTLAPSATPVPVFQICSPFSEIERFNLYKIISVRYRPPPQGVDQRHQGVDFVFHRLAGVDHTILGVEIQSILPGRIAASIVDSFPYGNLVIVETPGEMIPKELSELLGIDEGESLYQLYAHMLEPPLVSLDHVVETCDVIGLVGASGNTLAPHLHFETRIGPSGTSFPVMNTIVEEATRDSREYYALWRVSRLFLHFDPMTLLEYEIEK